MRETVLMRATTIATTLSSARRGSERCDETWANHVGRSARRPSAKIVRATPGMRLSNTPKHAMPAPTEMAGATRESELNSTMVLSGAELAEMCSGVSDERTMTATVR